MEEKIKEKDESRVYEVGFHMLSSLTEDELENAINSLRNAISKYGGTFISEGAPELINLSYTMSVNEGGKHIKYDKAYFGWIKFEIDPENVVELKEETLDIDKNILRYILIKTVREDTRAQMKIETLKTLEEVKTTGTIEKKQSEDINQKGEEVSDVELDKAVDSLIEESAYETTDEAKDDLENK